MGSLTGGRTIEYINVTSESWEHSFQRTGDSNLPCAIHHTGKIYRWHARTRAHYGEDFYKMFEDGPWKWAAQGRFAGNELNCGHYFGLSIEAASEEAKHYGIHQETSILLELEAESSHILDLTHPEVIRAVFESYVENHKVVSWSYYNMLEELIERGNGGNAITDYIGYRAKREGYEAILFYSARAMTYLQVGRMDRDLESFSYQDWFKRLRTQPALLNIVFFSGATVLDKTRTICVGDSEPIQSFHFGRGVKEIYKLFNEHDSDYQMEHDRFILDKPRIIAEKGKVY
jgi:hypothetical protein